MILHEKYLKCWEEFSYWLREYVLWFKLVPFKSTSFFNHWLFWFENEGDQLCLIWVIFWTLIWKLSYVLRGEIVVSLENNFWLPKPAWSTQIVETSRSFSNVSYTWYKSLMCAWMNYTAALWYRCFYLSSFFCFTYLVCFLFCKREKYQLLHTSLIC